nr:hypothetical protein [Planctomycetota bacterium]
IQTPEELLRELDKIRTKYNLEAHGIKPASKKPLIIAAVAALLAIGGAIWFVTTQEEKVFVPPKSQEQLEAERNAARVNAKEPLAEYVRNADKRYNDLNNEYIRSDIEEEDNWKKPVFGRIAKDAREDADRWAQKIKAWDTEKGDFEDAEILGYYNTYTGELQGHIDSARKLAKKIDDEISERNQFQTQLTQGRADARKAIDADVRAYAEQVKKLYDDKDYLALEEKLRSSELDDIVKKALEKKVGRFLLLKEEKDVLPVLDKHVPGDKSGKNRGMKWVTEAERRVGADAKSTMSKALAGLGSEPGFVEFKQALDTLKGWLDGVPKDKLSSEKAPTVTRAWNRANGEISEMKGNLEERRDKYELALLAADRQTYFAFLVDIWAPRTGLLRNFELGVARDKAEKLEAAMKHGLYQRLARTWPAPLAALEKVFQDVVAAYPDGWTEKYALVPDRKGKLKKETIKAIDATSVRIDRDTYTFQQLGAAGLLDKVFFVEGKPRLTDCKPVHRVGLGMLAELAGQYDLAVQQYEAAKNGADDELTKVIADRLDRAGAERQAAEKYLAVVRFLEQAEAWADKQEAALAEDAAKPGTLSDDDRGKIVNDDGPRFEKDLQSFQALRYELIEKAELAVTTWGSSIRERVHAKVAYAGERLPQPKKTAPPREPGKPAKKDAPK